MFLLADAHDVLSTRLDDHSVLWIDELLLESVFRGDKLVQTSQRNWDRSWNRLLLGGIWVADCSDFVDGAALGRMVGIEGGLRLLVNALDL